jgi:hypothetical protein
MAWAGLALSQPPSPAPPGGERILTLKEAGGTVKRCRVVVAWTMPEGGKAMQVQDVESGEMITVVQNGTSKSQRIIHWGKNATPPPGVPVPPLGEANRVEPTRVEAPKVEPAMAEPTRVEAPKVEPERAEPTKVESTKWQPAAPAALPVIYNGSGPAPKGDSSALPPPTPVIINAAPPSDQPPPIIVEGASQPKRIGERVQSILPGKTTPEIIASTPPVVPPPDLPVPSKVAEMKPSADTRDPWSKAADAKGDAPPVVAPPAILGPSKVAEAKPVADSRDPWGKAADVKGDAPPVVAPPAVQVPARLVEMKAADAKGDAPPVIAPPSASRPDPLTTPGFFPKTDPRQALNAQVKPPQPVPPRSLNAQAKPPQPVSPQPVPPQSVQPLDGRIQRVPTGMQSVVAAGDGPAQYIPVPIMTQPPVNRMPQAPNPVGQQPGMAGMPGIPSDQFVNAFTPAGQPNQMPPMPPMPMAGYGMYPRPMMPPMGYQPYAMGPAIPMGMPPGMVPAGYTGPMPPMPYGPAPRAMMPNVPVATGGHIEQQLATLKNALYPSHREMAVMSLSGNNAQYYPQVVRALAAAAKDDPAPTVRAACVGGLAKMQANSPEVINVLSQLRNDGDPRVRHEVDQALARLAPGLPPATEQPNVQPAQATQLPPLQ